jgi:hypothetical protein
MPQDRFKAKVRQALAELRARPAEGKKEPGNPEAVFRIDDSDTALQELFAAAGRDSDNLYHWRELLECLAKTLFTRTDGRRPKKYSDDFKREVLAKLELVKRKNPSLSKHELALNIRSKFAEFTNLNSETVRRLLFNFQYKKCSLNAFSDCIPWSFDDEFVQLLIVDWIMCSDHAMRPGEN